MRKRPRSRTIEAVAYLTGFAAIAVPGTMYLLSSDAQVAGWKIAAVIIAEFASGEAARSGFLYLYARGRSVEYR
ncbi:hypothetical protein [Pseudomonas sp. GV071]|uniref:hypothetical protein n=1 Tax=Pseudomonas sp. GV071 TaxID=2135754 RepID=UPI0011B20B32|nr:hypothetical protein [Pseudomonas sp. GV071]